MKLELHAPIAFDRMRKGYYYSEHGFSLKEFPLNYEEIDALDYAPALLYQLRGTPLFEHFQSAVNKVIEGSRMSQALGTAEHQIIQTEVPVLQRGGQWLTTIITAIKEKEALQIQYQPFGRIAKTHIFSPYLVKEFQQRWYCLGYSTLSDAIITFALDRIMDIQPGKIPYTRSDDFNSAEYFKYAFGIIHYRNDMHTKIVLRFSAFQAPYILSQPLHHSQELVQQNSRSLTISLQLYITPELIMRILSYGSHVKVLQPASLVTAIKLQLKETLALYAAR